MCTHRIARSTAYDNFEGVVTAINEHPSLAVNCNNSIEILSQPTRSMRIPVLVSGRNLQACWIYEGVCSFQSGYSEGPIWSTAIPLSLEWWWHLHTYCISGDFLRGNWFMCHWSEEGAIPLLEQSIETPLGFSFSDEEYPGKLLSLT